ncbi:MAG: tRNA 5-methoxyuridine(34)/uridine 5-oxyacetic acid(34) synthase CmoB [Gammaproteobacteria bacterium]
MNEASRAIESDPYLRSAFARVREAMPAPAAGWLTELEGQVPVAWFNDRRRIEWEAALDALPPLEGTRLEATHGVCVHAAPAPATAALVRLRRALFALHPWRKGPFSVFGIEIDAEWRSDLKWDRVAPYLADLRGRRVLDVGCGNGYYAWRLWGGGAAFVLGLDPSPLAVMQFRALRHYARDVPVVVLPLPSAVLGRPLATFDTALSMGVIYHRRDPLGHLREMRRALVRGGQLVLETLVVRGEHALVPNGRYARMRNVWIVPDCMLVERWLAATGFNDIRLLDVTATTTAEQRSTPWMQFESLAQCLLPGDPTRTLEGHPAPLRAVFTARAD